MDTANQNFAYTQQFTLPVHNFVDDMTWTHGSHSFSFGANVRFIRNNSFGQTSSFSDGQTNASWLDTAGLANTGGPLDPVDNGSPTVNSAFNKSFDFPTMALLGIVSEVDAVYNFDRSGNPIAEGTPLKRRFAANEYEFYIQDAWKARRNLTLIFWGSLRPLLAALGNERPASDALRKSGAVVSTARHQRREWCPLQPGSLCEL